MELIRKIHWKLPEGMPIDPLQASEGFLWRITAEDVGITRPNFIGFNYLSHTFTQQDVGRRVAIETRVGSDWTCWVFID